MTVGMGAVVHHSHCRRRGDPQGTRQAHRVADADGDHSAGQTHRGQQPADAGLSAAGQAGRHCVHRWDIFGGNLYDAAKTAAVLDKELLEQIRPYLESIEPMPAAFDQNYVSG